eukprot:TRINITY_DN1885_c0_g3_i1.p1 TRINITY_DN1885_c0_g3~~TRINITY_DN1885_c0_g3_i1.p1  ORF type:complete len:138 (+),score=4.71 TRINITY_DN1885_c0_g3_i1:143-556(+)
MGDFSVQFWQAMGKNMTGPISPVRNVVDWVGAIELIMLFSLPGALFAHCLIRILFKFYCSVLRILVKVRRFRWGAPQIAPSYPVNFPHVGREAEMSSDSQSTQEPIVVENPSEDPSIAIGRMEAHGPDDNPFDFLKP